jgi:hypothetical protein
MFQLTPAESKTYNQPCEILDFFDKHDIWHFLSATSMFFSFMVSIIYVALVARSSVYDWDTMHSRPDVVVQSF